jgi:UDP-N-acetylglucosamine diphosphorylase / glucose-1-phosphate thymidylyltransferase / UDP-N-acetylgalactosamine diphosphorylase / glucosamine-1-phosphate N-acetyltransferase / galactosamine-1-phosphate N-acetyltransferase
MDALRPDEASFADTLFPFTWTRSVLDIRIGILTLREKWERLGAPEAGKEQGPDGTTMPGFARDLPGNILPTPELIAALRQKQATGGLTPAAIGDLVQQATVIRHPWHIFELNGLAIRNDFALVTKGRQSQPIPPSVQIIGSPLHIFIEEGATISHSILNAATGPIYIGRNAEIMEGTMIRGPFALCEGSVVKMGATIYGATTIGPYSIVGGEIKNSVIFGYSNKSHHGYLGDSVIGEWCNLGAGSSNSNLKNNAGPVKVWDQAGRQFTEAGLKCGLLMGDYSRSAINTSFNTGTVVGICCNVFGEGLMPKYIPSFSWGAAAHGTGAGACYEWEKALRDIANWKKLKNQSLRDDEIQTLKLIFEKS